MIYNNYLPIIQGGSKPMSEDYFPRVMEFAYRWEGGFSNNPDDPGNWTGGAKGVGILKGTKYGISAASYPNLDIVNLTREETDAIYRRDYWEPSGASKAPDYKTALLLMDSGILHGVGAPQAWVREYGYNPWLIAARRLRVYTNSTNWSFFGLGWVRRTGALMVEMGSN